MICHKFQNHVSHILLGIVVSFFILNHSLDIVSRASDVSRVQELVKQVSFEFYIVNYQYSFTVKNDSDLDITSFKIADIQRINRSEKSGSLDLRSYPIAFDQTVAVPAKDSASYTPIKQIWNDCDNMISYVYYIEFSDGTKWGIDNPVVSEIPTYALTYETRYETIIETSEQTNTDISSLYGHIHLSQEDYYWYILIILIIGSIVVTKIIITKRKEKKKYTIRKELQLDTNSEYTTANSNYTYDNNYSDKIPHSNEKNSFSKSDPISKGKIGEYLAYEELDQIPGEKRLLHNIYIKKPNGQATEIDCLLIHQKGLFVIESKNYKGYIYGAEYDNKWTQVLSKKNHFSFYNPIRQNNGHIKNLLTYLSYASQDQFRNIPVYSIIAFNSTADISNIKSDHLPDNIRIIYMDHLIGTIQAIIEKQQEKTYTEEEILKIYNILKPLTDVSEEDKEKHTNSIY